MLKVYDVLGNRQKLDGGALFGNAPRAVWERWYKPDELNRIEFCCRALLVDTGKQRILLETGIGAFFEPKLKERFGVFEDGHVLLDSLKKLGLSHEDIDAVVLSHLHFDHAGGLLAEWQADTAPSLLFPKAQFVVGERAFARAKQPHPRDRASFIPELPGLLEASGRLQLVTPESAPVPGLECLSFWESDGHTPGMLHATVQGKEHSVFFAADLIPGAPWVHVPISMGYDRYPEKLIDEKTELYQRLVPNNTWLCFTHDRDFAIARVEQDDRGRYRAVNGVEELQSGWDLDGAALPRATAA